jgi:N-acetylneuraminic acid mutarotase
MKTTHLSWLLVIGSLFFCLHAFSQNYTWMRGLNTGTTMGVYGTQGVAAPGNDPGSRHGCATWTDAQGNLWLFGGEGIIPNDNWYSDLWKYNPTTNQWTWVKGPNVPNVGATYGTMGVPNPANNPGCREFCMSWTDAAGNFWLYGGDGVGATYAPPPMNKLGDLWKYNPTTNQWTWMAGPNTVNAPGVYGTQNVPSPANYPGGRYWGATWVDANGVFWLFGGRGYGASPGIWGRLNDLWKFDPVSNQWTWVSGSQTLDLPGVYGTLSVPAAGNAPGSRDSPQFWNSPSGKLVLFGGSGYPSTATVGPLNDMWEFNVSTGMWTWINGTNVAGSTGIYGTAGVPSILNMPGGRFSSACWTDPMGNYWLFGGEGVSSISMVSRLNDLFKFNPNTSEWTWMKGSNQPNQLGTYGTQGVAAASNNPGARYFNDWWVNTSTGYLWLFGGLGYESAITPFAESMNDLWKFKIPCNPDSAKTSPTATICSGNNTTLTAYNAFPSPVSWYTTPMAGSPVGSSSVITLPPLYAVNNTSVYIYYAEANSCSLTPRAAVSITVYPLPPITISGPSGGCPGSMVTLTISGALSYTWSVGASNSTTISIPSNIGGVTGSGTDANGCVAGIIYTLSVYPIPNVMANTTRHTICRGETHTLTAAGATSYSWNGTAGNSTLAVSPTVTTSYTVTGTDQNGCSNTATVTQLVAACTGIDEEQNSAEKILVYPNPNTGSFQLSLPAEAQLSILNQLGQVVMETKLSAGLSLVETSLSQGIYLYKIIFRDKAGSSGKLVVE